MKLKSKKTAAGVDTSENKASTVVETVVEKKAATFSAAVMKCTAKTWKADMLFVLLNFAWVHASCFADIIKRIASIAQDKIVAGAEFVAVFNGSKGNVARFAQLGKAEDGSEVFRCKRRTGEWTGYIRFADVECEGMKIERFDSVGAYLKTLTKAAVNVHDGSEYSIRYADNSGQYYGSVRRLENGKLIVWHEEHKRLTHNAHELSARAKELALADAAFEGEKAKAKRTIKAKAAKAAK